MSYPSFAFPGKKNSFASQKITRQHKLSETHEKQMGYFGASLLSSSAEPLPVSDSLCVKAQPTFSFFFTPFIFNGNDI